MQPSIDHPHTLQSVQYDSTVNIYPLMISKLVQLQDHSHEDANRISQFECPCLLLEEAEHNLGLAKLELGLNSLIQRSIGSIFTGLST